MPGLPTLLRGHARPPGSQPRAHLLALPPVQAQLESYSIQAQPYSSCPWLYPQSRPSATAPAPSSPPGPTSSPGPVSLWLLQVSPAHGAIKGAHGITRTMFESPGIIQDAHELGAIEGANRLGSAQPTLPRPSSICLSSSRLSLTHSTLPRPSSTSLASSRLVSSSLTLPRPSLPS